MSKSILIKYKFILYLEIKKVFTAHGRRAFVLPDGSKDPTPRGPDSCFNSKINNNHHDNRDNEVDVIVVCGAYKVVQGLRYVHEPARAIGQPLFVIENKADGFSDSKSCNGQVIFPQFEGRDADKQGNNAADDGRAKEPRDEWHVPPEKLLDVVRVNPGWLRGCYHSRGVGPDAEKTGYSDVEQSRVAPLNVQSQAENSVNSGHDGQGYKIG